MWEAVGDSLALAESALGMVYNEASPSAKGKEKARDEFLSFDDAFEAAMAIHTLLMGVVYFTHIGQAKASSPRLSHLHALLDSDALNLFLNGNVEVRSVLSSFHFTLLITPCYRSSFLVVHPCF